jgi:hypothetical protein
MSYLVVRLRVLWYGADTLRQSLTPTLLEEEGTFRDAAHIDKLHLQKRENEVPFRLMAHMDHKGKLGFYKDRQKEMEIEEDILYCKHVRILITRMQKCLFHLSSQDPSVLEASSL